MRGIVVKCKKMHCDKEVFKANLCKAHHYRRKCEYIYLGHKNEVIEETKTRRCLMCDKKFLSTGNRRCELCNATSSCQYESTLSLFIS